MYLLSRAKTGSSAFSLQRQIGASYPTAWLMRSRVMKAMAGREATHCLCGTVEVEDAYLNRERAGGMPGRRWENKVPIVFAASLNDKGHQ